MEPSLRNLPLMGGWVGMELCHHCPTSSLSSFQFWLISKVWVDANAPSLPSSSRLLSLLPPFSFSFLLSFLFSFPFLFYLPSRMPCTTFLIFSLRAPVEFWKAGADGVIVLIISFFFITSSDYAIGWHFYMKNEYEAVKKRFFEGPPVLDNTDETSLRTKLQATKSTQTKNLRQNPFTELAVEAKAVPSCASLGKWSGSLVLNIWSSGKSSTKRKKIKIKKGKREFTINKW